MLHASTFRKLPVTRWRNAPQLLRTSIRNNIAALSIASNLPARDHTLHMPPSAGNIHGIDEGLISGGATHTALSFQASPMATVDQYTPHVSASLHAPELASQPSAAPFHHQSDVNKLALDPYEWSSGDMSTSASSRRPHADSINPRAGDSNVAFGGPTVWAGSGTNVSNRGGSTPADHLHAIAASAGNAAQALAQAAATAGSLLLASAADLVLTPLSGVVTGARHDATGDAHKPSGGQYTSAFPTSSTLSPSSRSGGMGEWGHSDSGALHRNTHAGVRYYTAVPGLNRAQHKDVASRNAGLGESIADMTDSPAISFGKEDKDKSTASNAADEVFDPVKAKGIYAHMDELDERDLEEVNFNVSRVSSRVASSSAAAASGAAVPPPYSRIHDRTSVLVNTRRVSLDEDVGEGAPADLEAFLEYESHGGVSKPNDPTSAEELDLAKGGTSNYQPGSPAACLFGIDDGIAAATNALHGTGDSVIAEALAAEKKVDTKIKKDNDHLAARLGPLHSTYHADYRATGLSGVRTYSVSEWQHPTLRDLSAHRSLPGSQASSKPRASAMKGDSGSRGGDMSGMARASGSSTGSKTPIRHASTSARVGSTAATSAGAPQAGSHVSGEALMQEAANTPGAGPDQGMSYAWQGMDREAGEESPDATRFAGNETVIPATRWMPGDNEAAQSPAATYTPADRPHVLQGFKDLFSGKGTSTLKDSLSGSVLAQAVTGRGDREVDTVEDPPLGRWDRKHFSMEEESRDNRMLEDIMGGDSSGLKGVSEPFSQRDEKGAINNRKASPPAPLA